MTLDSPVDPMKQENLFKRAVAALRGRFSEQYPDILLNPSGGVDTPDKNLLSGVQLADFEADLLSGDGNELQGKFLSVHSSSALAVNTFARFRRNPGELSLLGKAGFQIDGFERKCSAGIQGRRSPNLDLVTRNDDCVLGIESKFTEHLKPHEAKFSPEYDKQIVDHRRKTAWFDEMHRLIANPKAYTFLDVAQLVKHAFGLGFCFPNEEATLLYIYWEPANADDIRSLIVHREEVARFAARVSGSKPMFQSVSYPDLWTDWAQRKKPEWLSSHVNALRQRYEVCV
jgi:hypothetical protein